MNKDYLVRKLYWCFMKSPNFSMAIFIEILFQLMMCFFGMFLEASRPFTGDELFIFALIFRFFIGSLVFLITVAIANSNKNKISEYFKKQLEDEKDN